MPLCNGYEIYHTNELMQRINDNALMQNINDNELMHCINDNALKFILKYEWCVSKEDSGKSLLSSMTH